MPVAERKKISKLAAFSSCLRMLKTEFGLGILVLAAKLKLRSFMLSDMTKDEFKEMFEGLEKNETFRVTVESISQSIVGVESRGIQLTMENAESSSSVGMEL